jgi:hypothetical protein
MGTIEAKVIPAKTGEIKTMMTITVTQNTKHLTKIDTFVESPSWII